MNTNSRSQNSLKNASSEIAVRMFTAVSKFILRTVFIYTLGIQYNGVSGLFNDILFMFSLAELGINRAIAFALYKPLANNDEDAVVRIMKFYRTVYRIIAAVIFVAGLALLPFLQYLVKDVPDIKESIHLIFMLFVVQSASSYLFIYKATLLEANQQKRIVSYVDIVTTVVQVVCESAILLIFKEYLAYLIFSIASTIAKNVVISCIAERKFPVLKRKNVGPLTKEESKQIASDIGATAIYNVSNVVVYSSEAIITAAFFPTIIVGILSNYRLIFNTINTLVSQISASCVPSIGNLAVTATRERLHELHNQLSFIMFAIGNFVCASLVCLLNPFVGDVWLNEEYLLMMPSVVLIVINLYLCIMQYPNTAYRNSNGLFVQGRIRPAIMTVIYIVLAVLFASVFSRYGNQWGVFGVLLATPLSRLLTETWYDPYVVYKHVFNMKMKSYFVTRLMYLAVAVFCTVATYFLSQWVVSALSVTNVYLSFMLRCVCCFVIPNAVVLILFGTTDVFKGSLNLLLSAIMMKKRKAE